MDNLADTQCSYLTLVTQTGKNLWDNQGPATQSLSSDSSSSLVSQGKRIMSLLCVVKMVEYVWSQQLSLDWFLSSSRVWSLQINPPSSSRHKGGSHSSTLAYQTCKLELELKLCEASIATTVDPKPTLRTTVMHLKPQNVQSFYIMLILGLVLVMGAHVLQKFRVLFSLMVPNLRTLYAQLMPLWLSLRVCIQNKKNDCSRSLIDHSCVLKIVL